MRDNKAPSIYNIHLKNIPTNLNNTVVSNLIKKVNLSILYKNLELWTQDCVILLDNTVVIL